MVDFVQVIYKGITIHQTDESGDSEWHFNFGVNNKDHGWVPDPESISSGNFYSFSEGGGPLEDTIMIQPGETVFLYAGGYEEDDPGFPLFDDHDGLPGFGVIVSPPSVSAGDEYPISASGDAFSYTMHYDINFFHFG